MEPIATPSSGGFFNPFGENSFSGGIAGYEDPFANNFDTQPTADSFGFGG